MRRFFLPAGCLSDQTITLEGHEARHLAQVLRLGPGDLVEFFDGAGHVYLVELTSVAKQQVIGRIQVIRPARGLGSAAPLTVAQSLLKGKKMDFLVQKLTELGVYAFAPIVSSRCENHGQREHQIERWHRIMLEACKQCHRDEPMLIRPVLPLSELDTDPFLHRLAAWENEPEQGLPPDLGAHAGPICLLLGPEGGLGAEDLNLLQQRQFRTISLGALILRGETAALAAVAIIQYQTGALRPIAQPSSVPSGQVANPPWAAPIP